MDTNGVTILHPPLVSRYTQEEDVLAKAQNAALKSLGAKFGEFEIGEGEKRKGWHAPAGLPQENMAKLLEMAGPQFAGERAAKIEVMNSRDSGKEAVSDRAAAKAGIPNEGDRKPGLSASLKESGVVLYPTKAALKDFKEMVGDAPKAFFPKEGVWRVDAEAPNIAALKAAFASPDAMKAHGAQESVQATSERQGNLERDRRGTQERAATAHANKDAGGIFIAHTASGRATAIATWTEMVKTPNGREQLDAKLARTELDVSRFRLIRAATAVMDQSGWSDAERKSQAAAARRHASFSDAIAPANAILKEVGYVRKWNGAEGRLPAAADIARLFPEQGAAKASRESGKAVGEAPQTSGPVLDGKQLAAPAVKRGLSNEM